MALNICGGDGVYIPSSNCDDCASLARRVSALEDQMETVIERLNDLTGRLNALETLLANKRDITIVKSDSDSSATWKVLGEKVNG